MSSESKILVTGAAGFIASKVCEMLIEKGETVVGLDNLNDYYDTRLKEYRLKRLLNFSNFSFYRADIERISEIKPIFEAHSFRSVFNLAARAGVRYSLENPWVYLRTNAEGTLNLLELMKDFGVHKFILASTSSLYAGLPMPFTEDLAVNTPISQYAASKKAAEVFAYTYHKLYGIDVSILRYFTVFGPYGRPDMAPYRFVKWILEGTPITLYGDGMQSRDFTFVDDIARGTILAEKELGFEVINLGGGHSPVTMKQVINWIEELTGKVAFVNFEPAYKVDMSYTMASIRKAYRLLNWVPTVSVYEGLKKIVEQPDSLRFNI
jgi:UDP-glucuronate 4-epimerase